MGEERSNRLQLNAYDDWDERRQPGIGGTENAFRAASHRIRVQYSQALRVAMSIPPEEPNSQTCSPVHLFSGALAPIFETIGAAQTGECRQSRNHLSPLIACLISIPPVVTVTNSYEAV